MAESLSFPRDLAECHRLMAQQQALFAGLEQRAAEQQALFTEQQASLAVMEQQNADQHALFTEQQRRYADLDQVLSRTGMTIFWLIRYFERSDK